MIRDLTALVSDLAVEAKANESLAPLCSVRAGGAAELLVRPRTPQALAEVVRRALANQLPLTVLGGGANTLVGDGGVPGITLKLPADLFPEELDERRITLGAGAAIARLIVRMKSQGLVGAEFLAGIPGTIGGAATMNAGTKNGECMSVVEAVELATADGMGWVPREQLQVGYRHTTFPKQGVITRVRFALRQGDRVASQLAMDSDLGYRKRTQPLSQPNFGSVFRNPKPEHAGRLIELAGLKGHIIGGAQISTVHANWIVNLGGAAARDVTGLMDLMQSRVRESSGVELVPEVKRVGVFC